MSKVDELIQKCCSDGVKYVHLGDITDEYTARNRSRSILEVRSVTNSFGLVRTDDFFDNTRTSADTSNYKVVEPGMIVYNPSRINVGSIARNLEESRVIVSPMYVVVSIDTKKIEPQYLDLYISSQKGKQQILSKVEVGARFRLTYQAFARVRIPLPPIEVQKEIVNTLGKFIQLEAELLAELEARRNQYEYYRNQLLTFDQSRSDVKWLTLDKIATNLDSKRKPVTRGARTSGDIPYYGASGIVDYVKDYIFNGDYLLVSEDGANLLARSTPIAFSISGKTWVNNHAHVLEFDEYATRRLVEIYLNSIDLRPYVTGGAQPKLNKANLNKIMIPVPSLDEQKRIVSILDKFDKLVTSISEGLPAEINARRQQYEYYRTKLLTFQELSK